MHVKIKLTVFYEEPFWVGVFEKYEDNLLSVCKVVFGGEPTDFEVYDFLLKKYSNLRFSNPTSIDKHNIKKKKINPKRLQRKIKNETLNKGVGTKSQLAIKLQYETVKTENKKKLKEKKQLEKEIQFALRQQKKKEKHKGH